MTTRRRSWPLLLAPLALSASCHLFDPQGRPCSQDGACIEGYLCSDGLCLKRGTLDRNQRCDSAEDCADGRSCRDAYCAQRCINDDNCGGYPSRCQDGLCACGRRCVDDCQPDPDSSCGDAGVCFATGPGFCQPGACSKSRDCSDSDSCIELGESGICGRLCLVLDQTGCEALGDGFRCVHRPVLWDHARNTDNLYGLCVAAGAQPEGDLCSDDPAQGLLCAPGLACDPGSSTCRRYCRSAGGSPECQGDSRCQPVIDGRELPYGLCR